MARHRKPSRINARLAEHAEAIVAEFGEETLRAALAGALSKVERMLLGAGPDLFSAYRKHRRRGRR